MTVTYAFLCPLAVEELGSGAVLKICMYRRNTSVKAAGGLGIKRL